jgi:hypothetical protein
MVDDFGSRTVRYLAIVLLTGGVVMLGTAWIFGFL